jgi:hypothetical protein
VDRQQLNLSMPVPKRFTVCHCSCIHFEPPNWGP